jgi:bile acid:Na+ symporter, BASS family
MDAAAIVKLAILLSVFFIVVSIGLRARPEDTLALIKQPMLVLKATLAMFVVMPLAVIFATKWLHLANPFPAALVALSVSPMPPILPKKEAKVGGQGSYIISLQVLGALTSIVAVPLFILVAEPVFGLNVPYQPAAMFKTLVLTVGAPLALGILIHRISPSVANRLSGPIGNVAMISLIVAATAVAFALGPNIIAAIGTGIIYSAIGMVLFGLLVGHVLGGPHPGNRGALAVATAARHPGVAIGLAATAFPEQKPVIAAAVLIYTLIAVIISLPYIRWRKAVMARL